MDAPATHIRPRVATRALRRHGNLLTLAALLVLVFAAMSWWVPSGRFLRLANFEGLSFVAPELGLLAIAFYIAAAAGVVAFIALVIL